MQSSNEPSMSKTLKLNKNIKTREHLRWLGCLHIRSILVHTFREELAQDFLIPSMIRRIRIFSRVLFERENQFADRILKDEGATSLINSWHHLPDYLETRIASQVSYNAAWHTSTPKFENWIWNRGQENN